MGKKKLKIAFLSFYSGAVYRGVETYVHELSNRLFDMGHDVTVYQGGKPLEDSRYETVTIESSMNWDKQGFSLRQAHYNIYNAAIFTYSALKDLNNDMDILIPTNGRSQNVQSKLWSLNKKTKIVNVGQSGPGLSDRLRLYTFPNKFVALTDYQLNWAKKVNPFVKSVTIPNGVDVEKFNVRGTKLQLGFKKPVVLSVSALEEFKRLDLAIRAVANLKEGSLLIVGKGEKYNEIKDLGESMLGDRFKILSFSYVEIHKVYTVADVFTFPTSPSESFGIVLLEAMASGLPVVATDDPIRREIVGDAGIFVDPRDTKAYSKALGKALTIKWGKKPREQAKKFSWDKIAMQYEELFLDLAR